MTTIEELDTEIRELEEVLIYLTEWVSEAFRYFRDPLHNPIQKTHPLPTPEVLQTITNPRIMKIIKRIN